MDEKEQIEKLKADLKASQDAVAAEKAAREKFERETVKKSADAKRAEAKAKFDEAVTANAILPSVRTSFMKHRAPKETDDAGWAEFDVATVDEAIQESLKPGVKSFGKSKAGAQQPKGDADDGETYENMSPSEEFAARVNRLAFTTKRDITKPGDLDSLVKEVMRTNPELAKARSDESKGDR